LRWAGWTYGGTDTGFGDGTVRVGSAGGITGGFGSDG
jgi:hypothetical protein